MKNALRFGAIAATAAVIGVAGDSARSEEHGVLSVRAGVDSVLQPPFPGIDGNTAVDINQLNLARELVSLTLEKGDLRDELDATRAQVEELLIRLDTMEQACEDATKEDVCPVGCESKNPRIDHWESLPL